MKLKVSLTLAAILILAGLILSGCTEETAAGDLSPDFTLTDLDGHAVSLSDFRGQPVLLNFWATWCGPCRRELPYLIAAHEKYQEQGLVILAVDKGEKASDVRGFVEAYQIPLRTVLDPDQKVSNEYNVRGIPTTFLIDANGILQEKIVGAFPNLETLEEKLAQIIENEPTETPPST